MVGTSASASSVFPLSAGTSEAHVYDGSAETVHLDSAALMFRGTYAHVGPDLAIAGPNGEKALIVGYFTAAAPATLVSPDGAILTGETVTQLAGARFAGAYAEAGPGAAKSAIGQVETASGTVTITHADGSKVSGAVGTPVFEGDVVETDGAGRVSITFADKTVATLGESARIVLDKFVYDPAGSGNSMLLNLVHGAFVFVAGLVAPTGDMKIETPVATMGIRGTTGIVRADIQDGTSYFTLKPDPAGKLGGPGGHVGAFDVFARLDGALIKEVRVPDQLLIVHNASGKFDDLTALDPREAAFEQQILDFAFAAHQQMLERIEGGQQPLSPDTKPPQPGPNNGNTTPDNHSKDAGLNTAPATFDTLRNPLDVDLLKQADPLGNETTGTGTSQDGNNSTDTGQNSPLLTLPVQFTNAPITVGFFQQPAEPGIHGSFPISFTGGATTPVITGTVATVSAIAFGVGSEPPHPFSLTSGQIAAIADAYNPATGNLSLDLDTTFLEAGQQVILTINVTISDGSTSATQSLVFAIVGLNDAPALESASLTVADTAAADAFAPLVGQLAGTDADANTALTYRIVGVTADAGGATHVTTAYGTLTLTAGGQYTFIPNSGAVNALAAGESHHFDIAVTVSDGIAPPTASTVGIDIVGANDAPVFRADGLTGAKTLAGTTTVSGTTYSFTHDGVGGEAGAVWQQVDLSHDAHWDVRAFFGNGPTYFSSGSANADGIVFAFQNTGPSAIGFAGGSLGITSGIPDAVGFKIDTYPFNFGDTGSSQFVQFFTNGDIVGIGSQVSTASLNDGTTHTLTVDWNAATKTLTYVLDGLYISTGRDIPALDFGGATSVFGGFVAATGAANSKTSVAYEAMANGSIGLIVERDGTVDSNEMRSISGSLDFTDVDHGATHTISVVAPGTDTFGGLATRLVSDASGEGHIEWTYTVRDGALDVLAPGETVTEVYQVAVNDGLTTSTTDVKITLVGRSDPYAGEPTDPTLLSANDNALSQTILGSGGNDVITLAMRPDGAMRAYVDGGAGVNALVLSGTYGDVDLTALATGQIKNVQEINLAQGSAQTLKLSLDNVLDMTGAADLNLTQAVNAYNDAHPGYEISIATDHALVIDGDHGPSGDTVEIVAATANSASGTWSHVATLDVQPLSAGHEAHDVYNFTTTTGEVLATIAVHHDVGVAQHAAAA